MENYYGPLSTDPAPPPSDEAMADDGTTATGSNSFNGNVLDQEFTQKYIRVEYGTFPAAEDEADPKKANKKEKVTDTENFSTGEELMTLKELVVANHIQLVQTIQNTLGGDIKICNQEGQKIKTKKIQDLTARSANRYFGEPFRIQYGDNGAVKYVLILQVHTAVDINTIKNNMAVKQVMSKKMFMVEHNFLPETMEISMAGFVLGLPPGLYSTQHVSNLVALALKERKCNAQTSVYSKLLPLYPMEKSNKRRGKIRVFVVETPYCDRDKVRNALDRKITKVSTNKAKFLSSEKLARYAPKETKDEAQQALHSHAVLQDGNTVVTIRTPLENFSKFQKEVMAVDGVVNIDNNTDMHAKGVFRIIISVRAKAVKAKRKIHEICGVELPAATRKDGASSIATQSSGADSTSSSLSNWSTLVNNFMDEERGNEPTKGKSYAQAAKSTTTGKEPAKAAEETPAPVPKSIQCAAMNPTPSTTTPASQQETDNATAQMAALNLLTKSIMELREEFKSQKTAAKDTEPKANAVSPAPARRAPQEEYRALFEEQRAENEKQRAENAKLREDIADLTALVIAQRDTAKAQASQNSTGNSIATMTTQETPQSQETVVPESNLKRKSAPSGSKGETPKKIVCAEDDTTDFR